ncbi:protein Spindly [Helicoverpa armigera]|uniref:protein Spindly n=1 Tax=Helicoverpa armigera TaxID=29058 RepID=UPI00308341AC
MDYSTISNKTNYTEAEELTNGELSERYYLLKKQYDNLSSSYEATKQELHDARRSYQTALDVQRHLTAELESYQADDARRKNDLTSRITSLQEEISELREERTEITERHAVEIKKFETQIRNLKEEQSLKVRESPERDNSELEEARRTVNSALSDAAASKEALEEAKMEIASWRMKAEEMISEMAEMRVAADLRREELRAANEREATALAELAEAKAMLHQCTDTQQDLQPHAAKGNSIFAEVEDKRQEMVKSLTQMKQTNSRLRRELANKQAEVDALLHEKQTVWEQQAGAAAHYDRELIESYEERITQLEGACEKQRRELARWFSKPCDHNVNDWLPAVLEHLKSECEQLRADVLSRGAAQLASAAQVRELRRKLALLTANSTKLSPASKPDTSGEDNKIDIGMPRVPVQVRSKANVDDVKKKVSFN